MKKMIPITVLVLGAAVFAAVAFVQPTTESQTTTTTQPVANTQPTPPPTKPEAVQEDKMIYVAMETSMGTIYIGLNETKAPISTENFLTYIDDGFYDKTIFHRVMKDFMVQGGGFTESLKKKEPRPGIKNEWENGLKNTRGSISMARLGRQPDSGTSQFFLNLADNAFLDQPRDGAGYAVFGSIVKGLDVLDAIGAVTTSPQGMHGNVPNEPIFINTVTRVTDDQAADLQLAGAEG